jgi:hypothetical protein
MDSVYHRVIPVASYGELQVKEKMRNCGEINGEFQVQ